MPNPASLRNLKITRVALVDAGANFDKKTGDGAHIMLFKSAPSVADVHVAVPLGSKDKKKDPPKADTHKEKSSMNKLFKRIVDAILEPDVTKRTAALTDIEKDFPPEAEADDKVHKADDPMCKCESCVAMRKSVGEEVNKRMTAIEKANTELVAKNTKLASDLSSEVNKRIDTEVVSILKSFSNISIKTDGEGNDVAMYRKMYVEDRPAFDRQMAILKATDAQLKQANKSVGSGRGGNSEGGAWQKIEQMAVALVEKGNGSITKEAAIEKVMLDPANMELLKSYREEDSAQA